MKAFEKRTNCDLCSSNQYNILLSVDYTNARVLDFLKEYYNNRIPVEILQGQKYEIVKCRNCDFIWQVNILNESTSHKLYNEWISKKNSLAKKELADFDFYDRYYNEIKTINHIIKKKPFQTKILDFGMGWGYWCLMAKAFGFNVYGFEISHDRIKYAKENNIKIINPFDQKYFDSFDFINTEQVFEHIADPLNILKSLVSNLKTDGIIRISVPNSNNIENKLKDPKWTAAHDQVHPLEHINCFTSKSILKMTSYAGLQPIDISWLAKTEQRNYYSKIARFINNILQFNTVFHKNEFHKYFRKSA